MALPTNLFDESWYLARNPDVAAAIEAGLISSALDHFNLYGKFENRAAGPLFNPSDYLAANPDVAEAVQAGLISAYDHFMQYGASESRSPLSLFDPEFYLAQNPDVAAAVEAGLITATEHFLLYGQGEPRQINPFINLGDYMSANADIAEAAANGAISPLTHLLTHGAAEGRDLGNGINLGIFANDPKFQEAVESGNLQAALERVEEVAPFLPTFEPPAGWEPPADTPIPTDFTPPEGTKLVIPPSVNVPDDVELPDNIFEPVTPPAPTPPAPTPTPPTPGGGAGGGDTPPPPTVVLTAGDEDNGKFTAEFAAGTTNGVIDLNGIPSGKYVVVNGPDLKALTVKGAVTGTGDGSAFYLDVGSEKNEEAGSSGNAGKITSLTLALSGDETTVWQWGTNALNIQTVNASGSTASLRTTIHAGAGEAKLTSLTGGSGNDTVNLNPHAFNKNSTLTINLGGGNDILTFDSTFPTTRPFTFDNSSDIVKMTINGGAGNDTIDVGVGATVSGGAGNDTFVVRSKGGAGQPINVITIKDYGTGQDTIDLTKVDGLTLQADNNNNLEVHQAGQTDDGEMWGDGHGKLTDALVQLSGGTGTLLVVENAYGDGTNGKTLAFKVTEKQAFGNGEDSKVKDLLINITNASTVNGAAIDTGAILVGGGGSQTIIGGKGADYIIGGKGADVLTGGEGDDTFIFGKGDFVGATGYKNGIIEFFNGVDRITDFGDGMYNNTGTDTIQYYDKPYKKNDWDKFGVVTIGENNSLIVAKEAEKEVDIYFIRGTFEDNKFTVTAPDNDANIDYILFHKADLTADTIVDITGVTDIIVFDNTAAV